MIVHVLRWDFLAAIGNYIRGAPRLDRGPSVAERSVESPRRDVAQAWDERIVRPDDGSDDIRPE